MKCYSEAMSRELNKDHDDLDKERCNRKEKIRDYYSKTSLSIASRNKQAVCICSSHALRILKCLLQATRAEEALDKIKAIKRSEKGLARNKIRTKQEITNLKKQVNNPPEYEAIEPLNEELVRHASHPNQELALLLRGRKPSKRVLEISKSRRRNWRTV